MALATFLVEASSHCIARNKLVWLSLLQRLSTLMLEAVVHKSAGSNNNLQTFDCKSASSLLMCDNTSAINLTKNQIQHSRTKHIEIRHHFIMDHVSNEDCEVKFIETKLQLADIFTKPLPKERLFFLRNELGILDLQNLS